MKKKENTSSFVFKLLWSKTSIGVAINKQYVQGCQMPLTTFYFWPKEDGWKLLKEELDSKPWMAEKAKVEILNAYSLLIHLWLKTINQSMDKKSSLQEDFQFSLEILGIHYFQ